jgi:hypothetical protein
MKYYFFTISLFFILSCQEDLPKDAEINANIVGCWIHDIEASQGKKNAIYKRCESKVWPKSRFRNYIKFNKDFTATFFNLAKNDAHFESKGTWTTTSGFVLCQDTDLNIKFDLKILFLTEDELIFE